MSETLTTPGRIGPGGETLLAGLLLLEQAGEFIPVDDAAVERALDPLFSPNLADPTNVNSSFTGLLRTAGYFILDIDQVREALESEPPEGIPAFPPLPFRRIWIEARRRLPRGRDVPTTYLRYVRDAYELHGVQMPEEIVEILGVGISEVISRRQWDVYVPFRLQRGDSAAPPQTRLSAYRITPSEIIMPKLEYVAADNALRALLTMAVNGGHLITARNVPHHEFLLPRPQRRRMDRRFRFAPRIPKMYYVDLEQAGEQEEGLAPTKRELHCRFLVRAHWRHLPHGEDLCTCYEHRFNPLPATFVGAFVKGPVGSPWKGRPVHRSGDIHKARRKT